MKTLPSPAIWAALLVAPVLACSKPTLPAAVRDVPGTGRPAMGAEAMVASAHPLATRAGLAMLDAGGNAVDAAAAVSFALSVVEPWSSGIGGGAFLVLHEGGETSTWDMREAAPAAATRDMYVRDGEVVKDESTDSARASGIPGLVRGLARVHGDHGKLPWARVVAPAIALAREGFPVSERMQRVLEAVRNKLNPAAKRVFLTAEGEVPTVGTLLKQPDLARTLEAIAASGGEAFYTGEVAAELVRAVRAEGGIWTAEDLAAYRVKEREPVRSTYRGYGIASMGPPSSGGLLLAQMLGVLERFDLGRQGWGSAAHAHLLAETMTRAYAMRAVGMGDPDHAKISRESFIGRSVIDRLGAEVAAAERATPAAALARVEVRPAESTHTSHFAVLTANGDAVSCTQTINLWFGSGRVAGSTGVVLNNEMDDFSAMPGAPNAFGLVGAEANAIAPGKRPLSSMTPTIVLKDGRVVGLFGSPGGSRIITTTLQAISNVIDFGMDVARAVDSPRLHHQWYPDVLGYEAGALDAKARAALEAMGHQLAEGGPFGNAMGIWRGDDGVIRGAADRRGEGLAEGR